jgi:uncharacterized protein YegL
MEVQMVTIDQVPFGAPEFVDNPEPRCPCLLLLDTSHSMQGQPIDELNNGLVAFKDELAADTLAMKRVEVAIVTFGPVATLADFHTVDAFQPPRLSTSGDTPMGAAIMEGLRMIRQRKDAYKANGIPYYRPWIFLITDGAPTDQWTAAAHEVRDGEATGAFAFFAVGVRGADMNTLNQIAPRGAQKLDGLRFRDLFAWLSSSLKGVSHSQSHSPGGGGPLVPVPPPGWTAV